MSAVVKGAHQQRGGMMAALMQSFQPLLVNSGAQRLKYVAAAESAGISRTLVGETLVSGSTSMNCSHGSCPSSTPRQRYSLLTVKHEVISTSADPELTLRRFELLLLEELAANSMAA